MFWYSFCPFFEADGVVNHQEVGVIKYSGPLGDDVLHFLDDGDTFLHPLKEFCDILYDLACFLDDVEEFFLFHFCAKCEKIGDDW